MYLLVLWQEENCDHANEQNRGNKVTRTVLKWILYRPKWNFLKVNQSDCRTLWEIYLFVSLLRVKGEDTTHDCRVKLSIKTGNSVVFTLKNNEQYLTGKCVFFLLLDRATLAIGCSFIFTVHKQQWYQYSNLILGEKANEHTSPKISNYFFKLKCNIWTME